MLNASMCCKPLILPPFIHWIGIMWWKFCHTHLHFIIVTCFELHFLMAHNQICQKCCMSRYDFAGVSCPVAVHQSCFSPTSPRCFVTMAHPTLPKANNLLVAISNKKGLLWNMHCPTFIYMKPLHLISLHHISSLDTLFIQHIFGHTFFP